MTGMPAFMAFRATGVIAAPSNGSSTIASTLSLMNVSTWLICRLTSLVPSATRSSTSSYFAASFLADSVIEPIQPWSAAGAEKPMTTFLPDSSLDPAGAAELPPLLLLLSPSLLAVLLVQAARDSVARPATRPAASRVLDVRVVDRDMVCSLVGGDVPLVLGVAPRRQPLLQEHGDDDDGSLEELLLRDGAVVEREDVGQRREDQDAEDGADDRAAPAGEEGAADDDGSDRVELVERAVGRAAGRGARDQHQRGHAAAHPDQDVEVDRVPLDVDAGQPGGLRVPTDRDRTAAERRPVEQHPADDRHEGEEVDLDVDAEDLPVEEVREARHVDDLGLARGDDLGQ